MITKLVNPNYQNDYLANLMRSRGISSLEDYLNPPDDYLQPPTNLKNIQLAAALYLRVVLAGGRILLVVDSDCDGYVSGAIMYQYTSRVNCHCQVDYVLHEHKEHGLSDVIERIEDGDVKYDLVLCPDSSSNDYIYHERLAALGIPCLTLDHHKATGPFSDNVVIVNNQLSPNYECKGTVGAAVAWQFCRHIDSLLRQHWADNYLDLAALATVGDMGSILEKENRWLVTNGFTEEHIKNKFLVELLNKQAYSITGKAAATWQDIVAATNPMSVAFYVVPLINALIRVGTMEQKDRMFRALLNGDELVESNKRGSKGAMVTIASESVRECSNARSAQNRTKDSAAESIEARIHKYGLLDNKILVFLLEDEDDFAPELNGLLAMTLASKFKKPTLILRPDRNGEFAKGSGRGLSQSMLTDFRGFLEESELCEYAQGHPSAFGCSIPVADIPKLNNYANTQLADIDFGENCFEVNFERSAASPDMGALILDLGRGKAIWGQENPTPVIYVTNIPIMPNTYTVMGAKQDTLKIEYNGVSYIKFHATDMIEDLKGRETSFISIVGKPNLNEWGGRVTPQVFVEDYEFE